MLSRLFRLAVLAVASSPPPRSPHPDKADTAKSKGPAVLVRVQSVNDLLKTADYIGTLLPEEAGEQLKQGTDFAKALIDDKRASQASTSRTRSACTSRSAKNSTAPRPVVVLDPDRRRGNVPHDARDSGHAEGREGKGRGLQDRAPAVPVPGLLPVRQRVRLRHASATPANIDPKTLAKPADVLGGRPEHLISATVRIDRLPDALKKMAIAGVENQLATAKEQPIPNETKAIKEFKEKAIDELAANLKNVLEGGEEAALRLNVDPKAEEFALEMELSGAKGSKLAKDIQSIRENKSVVGGATALPDAARAST